jgi:hypothetical protein
MELTGRMELMEPRIMDNGERMESMEDSRLFDTFAPTGSASPLPPLPLIYIGHRQHRGRTRPRSPACPENPEDRQHQDPSDPAQHVPGSEAQVPASADPIRPLPIRLTHLAGRQHAGNTHLSAVTVALSSTSLGPDAAVCHLTAWDLLDPGAQRAPTGLLCCAGCKWDVVWLHLAHAHTE